MLPSVLKLKAVRFVFDQTSNSGIYLSSIFLSHSDATAVVATSSSSTVNVKESAPLADNPADVITVLDSITILGLDTATTGTSSDDATIVIHTQKFPPSNLLLCAYFNNQVYSDDIVLLLMRRHILFLSNRLQSNILPSHLFSM